MVVGVYGGKPSEDGGVKQDTTALEWPHINTGPGITGPGIYPYGTRTATYHRESST